MQTVPSLVGTGSAVAAAASGFVFGLSIDDKLHLDDNFVSTTAPQGLSVDAALPVHPHLPPRKLVLPSQRRPAANSTASRSIGADAHDSGSSVPQPTRPPPSRRQRPQALASQPSPSITSSRPQSMVAGSSVFVADKSAGEDSRDSLTSSSSWLKRLSLRPLSQHDSPRSSILADSPSITFSHGSAAPILSSSAPLSKPLPPNKLVKRSSSKTPSRQESVQRRSRSHLPSLRRPATSHQRSATLQQLRANIDVAGLSPCPKYSFDEPIRPEELLGASPIEDFRQGEGKHRAIRRSTWLSFFHSKTESVDARPRSGIRFGVGADANPTSKRSGSKRVRLVEKLTSSGAAHLIKPRMVSHATTLTNPSPWEREEAGGDHVAKINKDRADSPQSSEKAASQHPRRSFSSSFSHNAAWRPSRSSGGSMRRSERGTGLGVVNNRRNLSAPAGGPSVGHGVNTAELSTALGHQPSTLHPVATSAPAHLAAQRTASSPLPPLVNLQVAQTDLFTPTVAVGGGTYQRRRPYHFSPGGSPASTFTSGPMSLPRSSHQRASSNVDSLDGVARELVSGDEDDTDFRSETVFDSLRTMGSSRVRAVETPLESVYDESLSGTDGKKKSSRLSIQEILDRTFGQDTGIREDNEFTTNPLRAEEHPVDERARSDSPQDPLWDLQTSSPRHLDVMSRDLSRLSIDDDCNEDWTQDEEDAPFNALSPPSKSNFHSSKITDPNVRLALSILDGKYSSPMLATTPQERSHDFLDLSESPGQDSQDCHGTSLEQPTSLGQQQLDSRGGRSVVRKSPTSMHTRSQSVPIVHDGGETKPAGSKYGTWGMGTKVISEDWDEDFEFGNGNEASGERDADNLFAVPELIRASQPSVKAHSGQIRELSLLVNDLKRLCQHDRNFDVASHERYWREAEGIIALASPDEEDVVNGGVEGDDKSGSSVYLDAREATVSLANDERGKFSFRRLVDGANERNDRAMSRNAVVRERQSPRRRSVFSPDDDIFGTNWPSEDDRSPDNMSEKDSDSNVVVCPVPDTAHPRAGATALAAEEHAVRTCYSNNNRVHFDPNNLKDLVKRARELRDILSDAIRGIDRTTRSPTLAHTPRHERRQDSSPAFTRVFDDPGSSPPRRSALVRNDSGNVAEQSPPRNSPRGSLSPRISLMTVEFGSGGLPG